MRQVYLNSFHSKATVSSLNDEDYQLCIYSPDRILVASSDFSNLSYMYDLIDSLGFELKSESEIGTAY